MVFRRSVSTPLSLFTCSGWCRFVAVCFKKTWQNVAKFYCMRVRNMLEVSMGYHSKHPPYAPMYPRGTVSMLDNLKKSIYNNIEQLFAEVAVDEMAGDVLGYMKSSLLYPPLLKH